MANPKGGWGVKKPGSPRASAHTDTQQQAVARARDIVKYQGGGEVRIHGRDGKIRDSATIAPGNDPNRPATSASKHPYSGRVDRRIAMTTTTAVRALRAGQVFSVPNTDMPPALIQAISEPVAGVRFTDVLDTADGTPVRARRVLGLDRGVLV